MLNQSTFVVEEYHQHIPLLLKKYKSGYVHSKFSNGMNIRMGDCLLFIGTTKNGHLPFGIHMHKQTIQQLIDGIKEFSSVTWNDESEQLSFENNLIVSFNKAIPYKNYVKKLIGSKKTLIPYLAEFAAVLNNHAESTGLDLNIKQFLYLEDETDGQVSFQADNETGKQVCALINAVFSSDRQEIEKVVRYFLGRGKGLTPSGDDHIVGLLAIHTITEAFHPIFLETVKDLIEQESLTTDISKEYLSYALKGEFSSSVANVMNDLTVNNRQVDLEKHLLSLMSMGHSSGVDTAFGMLIGIAAMRRNNLWEKK
jgi:hypothetical protein